MNNFKQFCFSLYVPLYFHGNYIHQHRIRIKDVTAKVQNNLQKLESWGGLNYCI